jgi:hypothetical protein
MTAGLVALLLGIFVVPAVLLWAGHRMRRRSARWHSAFWGAVAGHLVALVVGSAAGMMPAEQWADDDTVRGALGLWSFLVLPAVGAMTGALLSRRD